MMKRINNMIAEATSHHNDGWVMAGYKAELKKIYDRIQEVFPEFAEEAKETDVQ